MKIKECKVGQIVKSNINPHFNYVIIKVTTRKVWVCVEGDTFIYKNVPPSVLYIV